MNEETLISHLIARKITGAASEADLREWSRLTESDPEMEEALNIITASWNNPMPHHKKEMDQAFRKISEKITARKESRIPARRRVSKIWSFLCW